MSKKIIKKNIDQPTFGYRLLRFYMRIFFRIYYKKITVRGKENIPARGPIIFSINHQNALMDALAVVATTKHQVVFLARQDIFKGKTVIKILHHMKILPIYRIRDGASQLGKNEEVFDTATGILRRKNFIGIMPEGNHGDKKRLRPLVKGIFRIAFRAQDAIVDDKVQVIPVGLDFSDYVKFRSKLLVNYGKSIQVNDFMNAWRKNQPLGTNQFREHLREKMKEVMLHIENDEFYDMYMGVLDIYKQEYCRKKGIPVTDELEKLYAGKEIVAILDELQEKNRPVLENLSQKVRQYIDGIQHENLRDWILKKEKYPVLLLILAALVQLTFFPLHLLGLINNYIPYRLPVYFTRNIKDRQFHSSFKFVIALILFPVYYLVLFACALFILPAWMAVLYIPVMFLSGAFSYWYYIMAKKLFAMLRYSWDVITGKKQVLELKKLREEIVGQLDNIFIKSIDT
ncbi:MAG: 1-acyl-sn-glycerol-3-phosphate acyltransferase [Bacteroidales bacterium]